MIDANDQNSSSRPASAATPSWDQASQQTEASNTQQRQEEANTQSYLGANMAAPSIPPDEPTVVVPDQSSHSSPIFYLIFGITLLSFLGVSFLLFQAMNSKKSQDIKVPERVPTLRSTTTPKIPTVTTIPTPVDTVEIQLKTVSLSDEWDDIENDINSSDMTGVSESIQNLVKELSTSSKSKTSQ